MAEMQKSLEIVTVSTAEVKSPPPGSEVNYEVKARVEEWERVTRQKMVDHESAKSGGLRGGSVSNACSANTTLVNAELKEVLEEKLRDLKRVEQDTSMHSSKSGRRALKADLEKMRNRLGTLAKKGEKLMQEMDDLTKDFDGVAQKLSDAEKIEADQLKQQNGKKSEDEKKIELKCKEVPSDDGKTAEFKQQQQGGTSVDVFKDAEAVHQEKQKRKGGIGAWLRRKLTSKSSQE